MVTSALGRASRTVVTVAATSTALLLGQATAQAADIQTITDDYLFHTSLSDFVSVRASMPYADQLDWSSDACSWSPDKPVGFDFTPGCYRHDFGYRNYKKQSRFNDTTKASIDSNFYSDLKGICHGNVACDGIAWTYYQAVKHFGT
ncbi:MAG: phospholipase [Sciscionella sp.]